MPSETVAKHALLAGINNVYQNKACNKQLKPLYCLNLTSRQQQRKETMMQHRRRQAIFQAAKRAFQAPVKPADGKTARTKTAC